MCNQRSLLLPLHMNKNEPISEISFNDFNLKRKNAIHGKKNHRNEINLLTIAEININSLRNKLDGIKLFVKDKVEILAIFETKLDNSFPNVKFL